MNRRRVLLWLLFYPVMALLMICAWWLGTFQWSQAYTVVIFSLVAFAVYVRPVWRRRLIDIVGMDRRMASEFGWRWTLASFLGLIFSFYFLLGGIQKSIPPVLQFTIVAVSSTLGGLVMTSANNQRIGYDRHDELIRVAQKFIVATILFLLTAALLFLIVELLGDVDPNVFDISLAGIVRGICFWAMGFWFFTGTFLFSLGIIDLALTLRRLRRN